MAHEQHRSSSQLLVARCAIITLSDTRTEATDASGRRIRELLESDGHQVAFYQIIRDEPAELEMLLLDLLARETIDVVLTNGGTGISRRDQTIPLIQKHLTHLLPGFGELFRMLSWQQIGSAAMLSRAIAGIAGGKPLFAMPGSTKAVELAMTQLILPELRHLLYELRK
ncbi:MogA/MoaB family molybdenum cofactor biosynthesis protein [Fontivita pretiosa]|uniref:MogA/MoaB family molybdenum cofactor biosynthesis protein n=1 Tax=Fontivita pretiosa TaxID=2989684 RepID=UPI003D179245